MISSKFVVLTRGRTGSTAITDELGKCSSITTTQELFLRDEFTAKTLQRDYTLIVPFDIWKKEKWGYGVIPARFADVRLARNYLLDAERLAERRNATAFGWKVLSHQFDQRPFLCDLLKKRRYRVIYLRRKTTHQVVSGLIARQRGIYNSVESLHDKRKYQIDPDEFVNAVKGERECIRNDRALLTAKGFSFAEVHYEDYCTNREAFFATVFELLDYPFEMPPPSDFVRMIDDKRSVIENYDQVAGIAAQLGERL